MIDGREPTARRGRGKFLFGVFFTMLVGIAAAFLFWPRRGSEPAIPTAPSGDPAATAAQTATLYFGDRDGRALVGEQREIPSGSALEARIEAVIQALIAGPDAGNAVRTLPSEAQLQRVFHDADMATVYLDFSPAFVTRHPGGSAAEYATLGSIVRTLGANFPEVTRVQLLVDGQPIETLAGHFDTAKPIEIATWQ